MGTIEKVRLSLGKASDSMKNLKDRFSSAINRVQGFLGTTLEVAKNGSTFVGIDYSKEENIRGAIRSYVNKIQNEVAKINTDLSPAKALKGEIALEASEYVRAVTQVAEAYVSSLLAYSDKMHEYVLAFQENDDKLASNVKEETAALSSSAEKYVEKY